LTFGETLSEVCEPFSEYQGWLSSSWLQQQDLWLDVLPAEIDLPPLLPALPEGGGQSRFAQVSSAVHEIEVNAVTSAAHAGGDNPIRS
jgi:hypothetical protein